MEGRLSRHFKRDEFACRCGCGFDGVSPALVYALESVREHFNRPVRVLSGCRCEEHNRAVGGRPSSRHLAGEAADISVDGVPPSQVADYCESVVRSLGGVGRYETFTHIDVRGYRARWRG